MNPTWLNPPPVGLTQAERRVLEAFFVGQEVKPAAELLSLAPKTVNNELLMARQTMGESKSWVAAVRYVFHAKRLAYPFVEPQLVPKIERQIRRLLEDYFESLPAEEPAPAPKVSDQAGLPSPDRGAPADEDRAEVQLVRWMQDPEISTEVFERQLLAITECAAIVYELPLVRARKAKRSLALAFVSFSILAIILFAGIRALSGAPDLSVSQIDAALDATQGSSPGAIEERTRLVKMLSEKYYVDAMWGPDEPAVRAVLARHAKEIRAVIDQDPKAALVILGNAHRGLKDTGKFTDWFELLSAAVKANENNRGIEMVRALCGITLGSLNNGLKTFKLLSKDEGEGLATQSRSAAERAVQMVDRQRYPYDYANALRHLAMARSDRIDIRLRLCEEARVLYSKLPGERGRRGEAQCLLSIAESGAEQGGQIMILVRSLAAYNAALPLGNDKVTGDCVKQMTECVAAPALELKEHVSTLLKVRKVLWEWAGVRSLHGDDAAQFEMLKNCLDIDAKISRTTVAEDIAAMVAVKPLRYGTIQHATLHGFIVGEGRRKGHNAPAYFYGVEKNSAEASLAFARGQIISMDEAVRMAKSASRELQTKPDPGR